MAKRKKKGITITIIVILLIVSLVFGVKYFGLGTAFGTGQYIESPVFMYYECSPVSSPVDSPRTSMPDGVAKWVRCPDNTDQCDLYIQSEEVGFWSLARRIVYQICDSNLENCQAQVYKDAGYWFNRDGKPTIIIPNLNKGDRVYINYQKKIIFWSNIEGAEYYARYRPFILWKVGIFSGKTKYTTIEQGCVFPTQDRKNLINKIINFKKELTEETTNDNYKLDFYDTRNFIETFVPISVENVNFVTYQGEEGYCLNRQIFSISTVETNSGTYRIVDTDFNKVLKSSVECCPNEKEPTRKCNENFEWEQIQGSECSLFNPCAGVEWQCTKSKTQTRYNCENGFCVPETKEVECCSNNDCIGNSKGSFCDTKLWECIDVVVPPTDKEICNNGIDDDKDDLIDKEDPDCQEPVPSPCKWYDLKCQFNKIKIEFLTPLKIALVVFGFFLSMLLLNSLMLDFKFLHKKNQDLGRFAVAIVLAGLIAWLIWFYFWVGIIAIIIYIIYKSFFRRRRR